MSSFNLNNLKNLNENEVNGIIKLANNIDEHKVGEVTLVLDNDHEFYNIKKEYIKMVAKKKVFNYGLCLKGVQNLVDRSIKDIYLCDKNIRIDRFLNKNERLWLYNFYMKDIIEGLEEL